MSRYSGNARDIMPDVHTLCYICGMPSLHVCTLCGKHVCELHYISNKGMCTVCAEGKR